MIQVNKLHTNLIQSQYTCTKQLIFLYQFRWKISKIRFTTFIFKSMIAQIFKLKFTLKYQLLDISKIYTMAKNKKKSNQNKNVDVVEELNKEQATKEEVKAEQQAVDTVKEEQNVDGDQNVGQVQEGEKTDTNVEVKTQDTLLATAKEGQTPEPETQDNVAQIPESEQVKTTEQPISQPLEQPVSTSEPIQAQPAVNPVETQPTSEPVQNVSDSTDQVVVLKEEQKEEVQPEESQKVEENVVGVVEANQEIFYSVIQSQTKQEVGANKEEEVKEEEQKVEETKQEIKEEENKVEELKVEEPKVEDIKEEEVLKQVEENTEKPSQEPAPPAKTQETVEKVEQNQNKPVQPTETAELKIQNDLLDGLNLTEKVLEEYVFHDPLAHEQKAHGGAEFTGRFQPTSFHLTERMVQEANVKTPEKRTPERKKSSPRNSDFLQQIKQSAESINPDPLQLEYPQQKPIAIIKSLHSESDEEEKKRQNDLQSKSRKSSVSRSAVIHPPENPTYTNPIPIINPNPTTIPPIPQAQNLQQNQIVSQKSMQQEKKELDFEEINKQMLKQRQTEWQAIQQKQLIRKPIQEYLQPQQLNTQIHVQHSQPNMPQRLPYTNNLPIIEHERHNEQKQHLEKQQAEVKEKLKENQKLQKDIKNDNPLKKLGVAALAAGSCLAVCAFGKVDKKIAAGASILSFVLGYNITK